MNNNFNNKITLEEARSLHNFVKMQIQEKYKDYIRPRIYLNGKVELKLLYSLDAYVSIREKEHQNLQVICTILKDSKYINYKFPSLPKYTYIRETEDCIEVVKLPNQKSKKDYQAELEKRKLEYQKDYEEMLEYIKNFNFKNL